MSSNNFSARILGTGSYLPEKLLTNFDIEKLVETTDEWISDRTGIKNRHIAGDGEFTSDLALKASLIALKEASLKATDLDLILFATVSPDYIMPNTACVLQQKLGAGNCGALDISAACSGFVYGLSIAADFIKTGSYNNILVVGAEVLHNMVNYKDRDTCILFGDGAGAVVIGKAQDNENSKVFSHHLHADGGISDLFEYKMGGSVLPFSEEALLSEDRYMKMKGREIFKHAVRTMSECCAEALKANKMNGNDVDWVVPHQANIRIIEAVAKHFGIPMNKVVVEIENMGNTSAATVPVAFDKAVKDGRIKRGQNILLTAFGAGVTSGSLLLRY